MSFLGNHRKILKNRSVQFALYLVLASSILAVLPSYSAGATSAYDNAYQQTENLEIRGIGYGQNCSMQDITSSWAGKILVDSSVGSSFATALDSGAWAVAQTKSDNGAGIYDDYVRVYWTESAEMELDFIIMFSAFNETRLVKIESEEPVHQAIIRSNFAGYVGSQNCNIIIMDAGVSNDVQFTNNFTMVQAASEVKGYLGVNITVNYPADYEGDLVADGTADVDGDGLSVAKEAAQDTSDTDEDTDNDGLSDLTESKWFGDRDDVFCDTSTPRNCAYPDPAKKDIYVEIDWMKDSSVDYKPNATQLGLVSSGLDDIGYNIHLDSGQYGGGNALPSYIESLPFTPSENTTDFFDLKDGNTEDSIPANFNSMRKGIWRYVVSGYKYDENPTSSGAAFAGSDNVFVSYGYIEDTPGYGYTDLNTAIAGTIIHELGHSLCLSGDESYSYQSVNCIYAGIDTSSALTYDSVMNYNLQMFETHYSDGSNGSGDHDDWGAIDEGGIDDFALWNIEELSSNPGSMHQGLTIEQAAEADTNGTLGKLRKSDKIYDFKKNES